MKELLVAFLLAAPASARVIAPPPLPPACGRGDVSFDVKLDKSPHSVMPPEPGNARIYFFQDSGVGDPPTKVGLDGAWVGVTHRGSYFSVSVIPGEHHICAATGSIGADKRYEDVQGAVLGHVQAEAGKTYFYRVGYGLYVEPLDSDEGEYLIPIYPLSISHPKK